MSTTPGQQPLRLSFPVCVVLLLWPQ